MYVIKIKNKQKEWHPATKPLFQYLFMHVVCANTFGAIVLKPRFKIDAVIMIICSIAIIINSVLTLQVSTAKPMIVDLAK
jgi:hypothetical protein